jgi:hypothetical protein
MITPAGVGAVPWFSTVAEKVMGAPGATLEGAAVTPVTIRSGRAASAELSLRTLSVVPGVVLHATTIKAKAALRAETKPPRPNLRKPGIARADSNPIISTLPRPDVELGAE